jgi:alkylhydroperoxidase family enzyme
MRIEPSRADETDRDNAIVQAVLNRRGGKLIDLDRALLKSYPLASGWNTFIGQVRTGLALSPKYRELAMCVVAVINGAEYEYVQHKPHFLAAGGTEAQIEAVRDPDLASADTRLFDADERAVLALTIAMTRDVKVDGVVFAAARAAVPDERQLVELVGVIAAYNMVSRFLVALDVHP